VGEVQASTAGLVLVSGITLTHGGRPFPSSQRSQRRGGATA